jgi:hypothetical protein
MEIAWVIAGKGAGSAVVDSEEDAVQALTGALWAAFEPQGQDVLAQVLTNVWGPLRHRLVTEGIKAVGEGSSWSGHSDGLLVTLLP